MTLRKFSLGILIFLVFSLFAVLGYLSASSRRSDGTLEISAVGPTAIANQQNLLMIQVERLDKSPPQLRAVWIAGLFQSNSQTVLTFSQVFPTRAEDFNFSPLEASFHIEPNRRLSEDFLARLRARGLKWDAYALVDDEGAKLVDEWLRAQGVPIFAPSPAEPRLILAGACELSRLFREASVMPTPFEWDALAPHILTDQPAENLQTAWSQIFTTSGAPVKCEVSAQ